MDPSMFHIPMCARCGEVYERCNHFQCAVINMTPAHATRVRARYALGKAHNPDHYDNTLKCMYLDEGFEPQRPGPSLEFYRDGKADQDA